MYQYNRILVAVDGSKEAEKAFRKAIAVANRNSATMGLVHIIDTRGFSSIVHYDMNMTEKATDHAKKLLDDYKKEAEKKGISTIETYIEYGSPKTGIIKIAAEIFHPDLIMAGATGLNRMERMLVGSVTEHIIHRSPCDVLIAREDETLSNKNK